MFARLVVAVAVLLAAPACQRDLYLPEDPQRGSVSGLLDTGPVPRAFQEVALIADDGTRRLRPIDEEGAFLFEDLPPGLYYLEVSLPGFAVLVRPSVRVDAGKTTDVGTLAPTWLPNTSAAGTFVGRVVVDGGEGTEAAGGQVEFLLQPGDVKMGLVSVGPSGDFVGRVPPGSYTLEATHPQFISGKLESVVVADGETNDLSSTPVLLQLDPATVTGQVLREVDGAAAVPAVDALLTLSSGQTTTTDGSGNFTLTGLFPGDRTLRVSLPGHVDPEPSRAFTLNPGQTTAVPPLTLALQRGALAGTVVMGDQSPVSGVSVSVVGSPYAAAVSPDALEPWRGTFVVPGVPVGVAYTVKAARPGYAHAASPPVNVTGSDTVGVGTLTLSLLRGDFAIDDGDDDNSPGYTRTPPVTLDLTDFAARGGVEYRAGEDSNLADAAAFAAIPTTPTAGFTLEDTQGHHRVFAQYRTAAGDVSPIFESGVVLDSVAPTRTSVSLNGGAAFTNVDDSIGLSLLAEDGAGLGVDVSGVAWVKVAEALELDGSVNATPLEYQRELTFSRAPTTDGPLTLYAQFVDHAGNVSPAASDQIEVDTLAPSTCSLVLTGTRVDGTPAPAGQTASPVISAGITGCADAREFYAVNGPASCSAAVSASWSLSASGPVEVLLSGGEGGNTVDACVRDAAGNVAAVGAVAINLDTTPPLVFGIAIDGGAPYINAAQAIARGDYTGSVGATVSGAVEWALSETADGAALTGWVPYDGTPASFTFGGEGLRQVYAVFRDALGNTSSPVADQITIDVTAPDVGAVGVGLAVHSPTKNGFTHSVSVTVLVAPPTEADVSRFLLAEDLTFNGCGEFDMAAASPEPVTRLYSFTLSSGSGLKQVCARWVDLAGNPSALKSATIELDTTAPGEPVILTAPVIFNPDTVPTGARFVVEVSSLSEAADHARWEIAGGRDPITAESGWRPATPTVAGLRYQFDFDLVTHALAVSGVPNSLKVRQVDHAGNASSEASVLVTADTFRPRGVTLDPVWVTNQNGQATLHWLEPPDPDVIGYNIYYGGAPAVPTTSPPSGYDGTYAAQGISPVRVGKGTAATLSGLTNGSHSYVTVRAVDHAGNEGAYPVITDREVRLQPNRISPSLIEKVSLGAGELQVGYGHRLVPYDEWGYAFYRGRQCDNTATTAARMFVQPVHFGRIEVPIRLGEARAVSPLPTYPPVELATPMTCMYSFSATDLVRQGSFLFAGTDHVLRILDVSRPAEPVIISTIDLSAAPVGLTQINAIAVRGDYAFIQGSSRLAALRLSKLYDDDAATRPGFVDVHDVVSNSQRGGLVLTRDRLLATSSGTGMAQGWDITHAIDGDDTLGTAWVGTDQIGTATDLPFSGAHGNYPVGGDLIFSWAPSEFRVGSIQGLWTKAAPLSVTRSVVSYGGERQGTVAGTQAFLNDQAAPGLRIVDVGDASAPRNEGVFKTDLSLFDTRVFGNFALSTASDQYLRVFEVASPTLLTSSAAANSAGPRLDLQAGLLYSSRGTVHDLTAGANPELLNADDPALCGYDAVTVEDTQVLALGPRLGFSAVERLTDRDAATPWDDAFDIQHLPLSGSNEVRVTGVAVHGNYLVLAQVRHGADPGVWLEVMDVRKLRDGNPATLPAYPADVRVSLRLTATATSAHIVGVSLTNGRALLTLDDGVVWYSSQAGESAFIVDLRDVFDDDATTVLDATDIQARLSAGRAKGGVIRGAFAYIVGNNGSADHGRLRIYDLAAAVDEDPATTTPDGPPLGSHPVDFANAVAVHGPYAYVMPLFPFVAQFAEGVRVLDVTNPSGPVPVGFFPWGGVESQCLAAGEAAYHTQRGSVIVSGSKLYLSGPGRMEVVELD